MFIYPLILPLLMLLFGSSAQELQCHIEGQCSGITINFPPQDSYNLCLEECKQTPNCNWLTYYENSQECILLYDCRSVDTSCSNCFSGQVECGPEENFVCNHQGICHGYLVTADKTPSVEECLLFCQSTEDCGWYSYNLDTNDCILTEDCLFFDESCSNCLFGERNCQFVADTTTVTTMTSTTTITTTITTTSTLTSTTVTNPVATTTATSSEGNIFAVGGNNAARKAEVVDLSGNQGNCSSIYDYSAADIGSVGTFINNEAMVCGGATGNTCMNTCFNYNAASNTWTPTYSMTEARHAAAAVQLTETKWWITGGYDGDKRLNSTEMFTVGEGFSPYVDLPEANYFHNLVKINDTHIMLLGGNPSTSKAWLFNLDSETWSPLPNLLIAPGITQTGLATHNDGKKEVVVAAGINTVATQIFSMESMSWRRGPDFPLGSLYGGDSVQNGPSFFIVGGQARNAYTPIIHTWNAEEEQWVRITEQLSVARNYFAAFLVPKDFVSCT